MQNLNYCPMPLQADDERIIDTAFRELMACYLHSNHRKKVEVIGHAYRFACQAHKGMRRLTGEPYILHPIAVARIAVEELGLGSTSICAALLHEVVEEAGYSIDDVRDAFGDKIAEIVSGLTKISGGIFGDKASDEAENFRKMLLSMSSDFRVLLVKMADRLHNLRTIDVLRPAKQRKIARETLYVYAPLAHRLGLGKIKTELEELAFRYEHPAEYADISRCLRLSREENDRVVESFIAPIRERLDCEGFRYEIKARVKTPCSIYRKMQKKGIPFEEVYDVFAVRVIFENDDDNREEELCRRIYDIVADKHHVHPDRVRDWLSTPKANGYRALHITVENDEGRWIEVQIRSRKMDDIAELGYAAHWKYKTGEYDASVEFDNLMNTIKDILSHPGPDELDFLETIRLNLFSKDIYVFTRDGDLVTLPAGATVLDLACAISPDTGRHCVAGKIDHRLLSPSGALHSGDRVEIITSDARHPEEEWLEWCTTPGARHIILESLRSGAPENITASKPSKN